MQTTPHLLTKQMLQTALPVRAVDAHKGTSGSVAIIGGDDGMLGAVLLAARAALLSGAGRIYAAMLCETAPAVDLLHPEIMMRRPDALATLAQLDAVAIGPGLGQSDAAITELTFWLTQACPLVLDADALNLIAQHHQLAELLKNRRGQTVLTPHAGEAARLMGVTAAAIQSQRVESAVRLAQSLHVICVLKGAGTIIAEQNGSYCINTTGNSALATGGTGDVLTGVIASLIAQGLAPIQAARLGVYVHGAAADALVARGIGPLGLTASELVTAIRDVLNQLSRD
ncbi:NAD(P)H-hydrate dehydratase [Methylotenera mobilis]|uniref:ADP-dependent (S)-NAD(P)H-hydrate dehydratase n=1 Tax=Methylotenera mobilis (strain JLW8 / ATCC BAA-1282 / DSM 17540) TaxID=583345 RepID=C6WX65_METML|nr:NAD(P)H-hydrate dehydratase [Methylotenera mobilis]ACT48514.1 carbohydrate kinase, YjeF related protein [Methylotenera mobilis JLW8]